MPLTLRKPSQELIDLVGALGGTWHGRSAMCRCPAHADRTPSLSIRQGDRGILVTCFAGCSREAVLRELRRVPVRRHYPYRDAPTSGSGNAIHLWHDALPLRGTPGALYLASRGLSDTSGALRFHPNCPCGPKPRTAYMPALIAAVRDDNGIVAIHRTFLDPATSRLAPMEAPKRALGRPGGGAVRLGRANAGKLGLAEGIETALSVFKLFDVPCWAVLGNERFGTVAIPDDIAELHLFVDADSAGALAEHRARATHARDGRTIVTRCPPQDGEDWNDVLLASLT